MGTELVVVTEQAGEQPELRPAALYRVYDADGALLYVGVSVAALQRLYQHERDKEWWMEVRTVTLEMFDDSRQALSAEVDAIATERPKYNKSPGGSPTKACFPRRRRSAPDPAPEPWSPNGAVLCSNCGRRPESIPYGRSLSGLLCRRCGCKTLMLDTEDQA